MSLALLTQAAHAASANRTGGTDALWSNTAYWSASPVPGKGDTATFNAAVGACGAVIDLGSGVMVNTISFVGAGPMTSSSAALPALKRDGG